MNFSMMGVSLLKERLKGFFEKVAEVELAYLFGSYTKGSVNKLSDVDIAVLLKKDVGPKEYLDIRLDLIYRLGKVLDADVDVVVLNQASPLLNQQVIKYGEVVYEESPRVRIGFETRACLEYLDAKPLLDFHTKVLLKNIKEVGLGRGYRGNKDSIEEIRRISKEFGTV